MSDLEPWQLKLLLTIAALVVLVAGGHFRLRALRVAGATPPGIKRTTRAAWVLGWDIASFVAASHLLRLTPFPMLLAFLLMMIFSVGALELQWFFGRRDRARAPSANALDAMRAGVQGAQEAAYTALYQRAREWVDRQIQRSRLRAGMAYQLILVGLCVALRALEVVQGWWLYLLFSLLWQSGITALLYWRFDRKGGAVPSAGETPSAGGRQAAGIPGFGPRVQSAAERSRSAAGRGRKSFAGRSEVQGIIAFSAGAWCGIFSRHFGWWYGFASVTTFRTLLRLGPTLLNLAMGQLVPARLQGYVPRPVSRSLFNTSYLKSREFWYGPGMGLVGGIVGAALRQLLLHR